MIRKSTAQDVATAAGVSVSTVDRVLNNRGGVAKHKETRVLAAARTLRLDRALDLRAARTLRIAVVLQALSNPFHAQLQQAAEDINAGPNPYNLQLRVFHTDPTQPAKMAKRIREVAAGHDALIVSVSHHPLTSAALDAVLGLGKPVITLATDIETSGNHIYVGPDNRQAGRIAGDLMGRFLGAEGGELLLILGLQSLTGQAERGAGFRDVLAERYPACTIVDVVESLEDGDRAGNLTAHVLKARPALRGIYNASAGALPMAQAVDRAGRIGSTFMIAHDLTPERHALLKQGWIHALIDQDPVLEIQTAQEILAAYFGRREAGPTHTNTPLRIHTRETC